MNHSLKLAPLVLATLFGAGIVSLPMTVQADKPTRYEPAHPGKVIVIKKPDRGHDSSHHHREQVPRKRHYHGVRVWRPYGHPYGGYAFYYSDDDAYKWLAFTAIALKILDNMNEEQQRLHEAAQVRATTAAVGETIVWEEGDASGSVTTIRKGTSTSGRQCREFQQRVTIGGKTEEAYGTACLQPDGSWEIVK